MKVFVQFRFLYIFVVLMVIIPIASASNVSDDYANKIIDIIVSDMTLPHEGKPHGLPASTSWASKPRVGWGNNSRGFNAILGWGLLYETLTGNTAINTRVQIKGIKTLIFSKKKKHWEILQESQNVVGLTYKEELINNISMPADIRAENDGSVSVKIEHGYNFHFWPPSNKIAIDSSDIGGVLTIVQARLIIDNPAALDDRYKARYILNMGADYWLDVNSKWDYFKTNRDVGIGRFKYITNEWKMFTMTTMSEAELRSNPPPVD